MNLDKDLLWRDRLYIYGEWVCSTGNGLIDVIDPATETTVGTAADATETDVNRAVFAARHAFDHGDWPHLPPADRAAILGRAANEYDIYGTVMGDLITAQNGSPITFTRQAQVPHPLGILDFYATLDHQWTQVRGTATVTHEPVGVVAVVVPWNMPQKTIMMKVAPALLAGCTIVVKPAPETPLDALYLAQILDAAGVPEGVFNVVTGGTAVGEHLVTHPDVDKVAFTGSTAAGRRIAALCGNDLRRVSLELGGKSACLILDDADLDQLIQAVPGDSLANSGQICSNQTRLLVPAHLHDELLHRLIDLIDTLQVGDPTDPATDIGPLVAERQRDRVEHYLHVGQQEGAVLIHGGHRDARPGWFIHPALFANVHNDMTIAREEIFGPVLAVIPYQGDDHGIALANANPYGLAAGVWTRDPARAAYAARRLRAGTVHINATPTGLEHPLGGYKASGIGRELGPEGLDHYLETKVIAGAV